MSVLVLGSGVMGKGIAKSFIQGGITCSILSRNPSTVQQPVGVTVVSELPALRPDLIIESVPEDAVLKQDWYSRIEAAYPEGVPLASKIPPRSIFRSLANRSSSLAGFWECITSCLPMSPQS